MLLIFAAFHAVGGQPPTDLPEAARKETPPSTAAPSIVECRVGFANHYKVGFWTPVSVTVANAAELVEPRIDVVVVDSDGVQTTVSAPVNIDVRGGRSTTLLYTKVGRTTAPIHVALVSHERPIARRILNPTASSQDVPVLDALPALSELVLSLGGGASGLGEALADRYSESNDVARRVVEIDRIDALPDEWFGYEAVDLLVLSARDVELCQALADDEVRLAALRRWVELGGRLVITCDGDQAEAHFGDGLPLAALLPGRLAETVRLTETTALEHFAQAPTPIAAGRGARVELAVPKLVDVRGNIDAYAGRQPTDLPLVVRAPMGFGEVAFVGLDLASPPLSNWVGREALWRAALRPYVADGPQEDAPQTLGTLGYNDLSGALRQRLGRTFPTVRTVTFPTVALFVIVYLVLLGPAHYWLVHYFGGRPALAWVVFPLLVLVASGVAYWITLRSKGAAPSVNQVELVDFDVMSGRARGTYWAALYSPESQRFDVGLSVSAGDGPEQLRTETLLSWWGLPGVGVGGMHAGSLNLAVVDDVYRFTAALDAMLGLPIFTSATKSIMGRWVAPTDEVLRSELADDNGMVVGVLENSFSTALHDVRLLYGTWAYRLGDLAEGEQVEIGQHLSPITVNTLVTRRVATGGLRRGVDADRTVFFVDRASTEKLLTLMMFSRAAGGETFAHLPHRYQLYCDLSRHLELGRAVLVAEPESGETQSGGSRLVHASSGEPLADNLGTRHVVYRFVLPVEK